MDESGECCGLSLLLRFLRNSSALMSFLVFLSGIDRSTRPASVEELFASFASGYKEQLILEGDGHSLVRLATHHSVF